MLLAVLSLMSASAAVPTVTTQPATLITPTSARIWGRILDDGGGAILERRLEWGIYGTWTDFTASVTVSGNDFYYGLSGLSPTTRYQFRAWARSSAGWAMSGAGSFTTTGVVGTPAVSISVPSGNVAVGNGTTSYAFSGSASAPGSTVAAVQWRVSGGSWNNASGTTSWSFTVPNLAVGQNVVDVRSRNALGTYSSVVSRTITRAGASVQVPTVTAQPASSISASSARLWGRVQSDGGATILERRLEWGPAGSWINFTANVTVSGGDFYYDLSGLSPNTSYQFRAWARNSVGWAMSGAASFSTTGVVGPTVTISASDSSASESGPGTGTFTLTRTGSTASSLLVNYSIGGTAISGSDYSSIGTSVSIPAGSSSATRTITPINDTAVEATETVVLTLTSGSYTIGSPSSATVNIADNDSSPVPIVSISASDSSASESGPGTGRFTLTRTGSTASSLTVNYTIGGMAINGSDYSSIGASVSIPAGSSSATRTITPINDTAVEATETVVLTLTSGSYTIGSPNSATVNIVDNDASRPSFQLPFACGETWFVYTYSGHGAFDRALDINKRAPNTSNDRGLGQPVLASADGVVKYMRQYDGGTLGTYVVIDHGGGWITRYGHMVEFSIPSGLTPGEPVLKGQQIGNLGNTGDSEAAHLHYEQRLNDVLQHVEFNGQRVQYVYLPSKIAVVSANCADYIIAPMVDAFEIDNTAGTAKVIANGQTQSHSIRPSGNQDWAKFTVGSQGANNVVIETDGSSGDTELWIYGPDSTAQVSGGYDDDHGNGLFSRVTLSRLEAGTYFVKVRAYGNVDVIPDFTLQVRW